MALVLSFLSNLHQTERECQRISDAASPTPISDPAKISELKPTSQISKPNPNFQKLYIIKTNNPTYVHSFCSWKWKEINFFCAINVMITITKEKPINFFNPKKKKKSSAGTLYKHLNCNKIFFFFFFFHITKKLKEEKVPGSERQGKWW